MRALANFFFSFLLPQKLIRSDRVSISSKPMLCEVANTKFKKSKNSLAILHNASEIKEGGAWKHSLSFTDADCRKQECSITHEPPLSFNLPVSCSLLPVKFIRSERKKKNNFLRRGAEASILL